MAYTNFQNCTKEEFEDIIYSGESEHILKISFNGHELLNADEYCEKLTRTFRSLPNDGKKRFSLDNFMAQEIELIFHNLPQNLVIADPVNISIGTLVDANNNTYEYVPLGIFNIIDNPVTDKDKTTIKLMDNRVKFDFCYNGKPLIDAHNGSATKMQILQDICIKAGVTCRVNNFLHSTDLIGTYDSTITATIYVSYLAEQAGCIPAINRNGELIFVSLDDIQTQQISLDIVEKYELGEPFSIQRVVYESGVIKYETSNDETLDTLFINGANPYIDRQEQINNIFTVASNFNIDSVTTGTIMGNPAIDPYDLIEIYGYYDNNEDFVDDRNTILFRTLVNATQIYKGKLSDTYSTQIGKEERTENVSIKSAETFKKSIKTEVNNIDASLKITAEKTDTNTSDIASIKVEIGSIESQISNISGMTVTKESYTGSVNLDDIAISEPVMVVIRPTTDNISYLYHSTNTFHSANTFHKPRKLVFHNNTTNEDFEYILPRNLLHFDEENNDEFLLDYHNQAIQVTKKVAYNADGTTHALATPEVITFTDYPTINLTEGNYTVYLPSYTNAYISVTLVTKNIYTDQFYLKAETDSKIAQSAEQVTIGVNQTLTNYFTKSETTAEINTKAGQITQSVAETYTTIDTYNDGVSTLNGNIELASNDATNALNTANTIDGKLDNYATNASVNVVRNSVTTLQTASQIQTEFMENIQQNGVDKVKTTTNYTLDKDGLQIKKSDEPTESKIDNNGVTVKNGNETLLFAGYDSNSNTSKVEAHDMSIQDHEILMEHIRVEEYSTGVGWFWLG